LEGTWTDHTGSKLGLALAKKKNKLLSLKDEILGNGRVERT